LERSSGVEIRSPDELLQREPVARRREGEVVDVAVEVEPRLVLPGRDAHTWARLHDPLAEAREALDEALTDDILAALQVHGLIAPEH
jgi:hypothetical protein